ncbi:MAG: muconolactone Delta-isomerase family protein [Syntrophorhabdales bacterium]|jgi:muconolactone delta-isomerase
MKFMVISGFKDSFYALPPEKQKKIDDAQAQFRDKLIKEGKLKEIYVLGNMKGAMVIYDLNSSEDLARLAEAPIFPFMDWDITPLVEMDVVRKVQAKK